MTRILQIKYLLVGAAVALAGGVAGVEDFPERPIDLIVGFNAGDAWEGMNIRS